MNDLIDGMKVMIIRQHLIRTNWANAIRVTDSHVRMLIVTQSSESFIQNLNAHCLHFITPTIADQPDSNRLIIQMLADAILANIELQSYMQMLCRIVNSNNRRLLIRKCEPEDALCHFNQLTSSTEGSR